MDGEDHVCPACGQRVDTVVGRHKTLGAWVPRWGPGPCRNPDCPARAEQARSVAPGAGGERPGRPDEPATGQS